MGVALIKGEVKTVKVRFMIYGVVILFMLACVSVVFIDSLPLNPWVYSYRFVGDDNSKMKDDSILVFSRNNEPQFIIKGGKLYLETQRTRSGIIFVTVGNTIKWDNKKIAELLKSNPQIGKYLPNLQENNFGIKWID
jgi:hypothetical protein